MQNIPLCFYSLHISILIKIMKFLCGYCEAQFFFSCILKKEGKHFKLYTIFLIHDPKLFTNKKKYFKGQKAIGTVYVRNAYL